MVTPRLRLALARGRASAKRKRTRPAMIKHLLLSLLILPCGLLGVNALAPPELERYTFTEPHMGTTVRIVLYAPDEATAKKAAKAAFARIAELNKIMSDYDPESEL